MKNLTTQMELRAELRNVHEKTSKALIQLLVSGFVMLRILSIL